VAGCTGGGGPSSVFTPTPQISTSGHAGTPSPSRSATSTGKASASAKASATGRATPTGRATATGRPSAKPTASDSPTSKPAASHSPTPAPTRRATHAATPPATQYPVGAPQTGGGGTAGLQDVTLFGIGGAAILSGIASLAYRRRLTRKRRAKNDTTPSTPTHAGTR